MRICMAMGQAAAGMNRTKTTTDTVQTDLIRRHLMERGVLLED